MATGDRKLAPHVQEILHSAQQELQQLNRERAEVVKRICTIKRTLVGLVELFGENILDDELSKLILPNWQWRAGIDDGLPRDTSEGRTFADCQ